MKIYSSSFYLKVQNWSYLMNYFLLIRLIGNISMCYSELEKSFHLFSWDHKHYSPFGWRSSHTHTRERESEKERYRGMFSNHLTMIIQRVMGKNKGDFSGVYISVFFICLFAFVKCVHWYCDSKIVSTELNKNSMNCTKLWKYIKILKTL